MKINRIALSNVGPYVGENTFVFDTTDRTKNMVLIGGKNGAGKTTLFKSIKICLYGCTAFGFEANNQKYYSEIEQIINSNEKIKRTGAAFVEMDLLFDDGMYNSIYTFTRSWRISGKRIIEDFSVQKNGSQISESEKEDLKNYLHQLIPPNLFRFYFFDGERISDFVFSGNKTSDFKEAFLKLCSLDTLEIIKDNFQRLSRSRIKAEEFGAAKTYDESKDTYNLLKQRVSYAEEEYSGISSDIIAIDDQIASLEKTYAKGGGITKKEWQAMQAQITKEELKREETRKWLKDVANNVLPFIIVKQELASLKGRMNYEHNAIINASLVTALDDPDLLAVIKKVLSSSGIDLSEDITNKIAFEVKEYANSFGQNTRILNLSEMDRIELIGKINSILAFDTNRIKSATDEINSSLNCVKRIRQKMEKSSVDSYDTFLQRKSELNERKAALIKDLLNLDQELQSLRSELAVATANMTKARESYELFLKKQSINDISARAFLAFDELQKNLYSQNIQTVEKSFQDFFLAIINKSDLIDGIYIDDNLNVFPYKNKEFSIADLKSSINKNGTDFFIAQLGLHAYEVYEKNKQSNTNTIVLPVEIKQQLSAGEKQIFIMALYQSLSKLNRINVPYIIDTPFARIDKEHREKILEKFFKHLSGQVIILSTDEEIVSDYYDILSERLSNTFVIKHSTNGTTEVHPNTYFGGIQ